MLPPAVLLLAPSKPIVHTIVGTWNTPDTSPIRESWTFRKDGSFHARLTANTKVEAYKGAGFEESGHYAYDRKSSKLELTIQKMVFFKGSRVEKTDSKVHYLIERRVIRANALIKFHTVGNLKGKVWEVYEWTK